MVTATHRESRPLIIEHRWLCKTAEEALDVQRNVWLMPEFFTVRVVDSPDGYLVSGFREEPQR